MRNPIFVVFGGAAVCFILFVLIGATFRRVHRHLVWLVVDHRCAACGYPQVVEGNGDTGPGKCPECGTLTLRH